MALNEQQKKRILRGLIEVSGWQGWQVANCVTLFESGATVPFVARYRKEQTGELDEVALRDLQEQLRYFTELEERKRTVLKNIELAGALSESLQRKIDGLRDKTTLEDLYLPYKPRRRTRATMAREKGLEPLAKLIGGQGCVWRQVEQFARQLVIDCDELTSVDDALKGAADILAEGVNEQVEVRERVRRATWQQGVLQCSAVPEYVGKSSKYESYYQCSEPLRQIPSHRMLAMRRGETEEVLRLTLRAPEATLLPELSALLIRSQGSVAEFMQRVIDDAYHRLLAPSIEVELRLEAKKGAEQRAIQVFAENLRHVLLAPPAANVRVLGVDPGLRTGSKLAVVSETGRFLEHLTIYPHTQKGGKEHFERQFSELIQRHGVELIAVGNGTGGREMETFSQQVVRRAGLDCPVVMVSEAGASIYSASDIARQEFPDLDLTVRGAISIARRLQDPLAELVKVDAKSIGVGQYQHDVNQRELKRALDAVVESCVNYVGVDLNTASAVLLSYVSGIGPALAEAIVAYRDNNGPFVRRRQLLKVARLGAKSFQQAAGFLRVKGDEPLDNSAVHPEHYALVKQMATDLGLTVAELVGQGEAVKALELSRYVTEVVGLPTLRDIRDELLKPGRDPRQQFETVKFREDVTVLADLEAGMQLQGCVTNVAAFGAFVDIGVHQDGLVHISELADRFVKDPAEIVKVGQVVHVKVLSVDEQRRRIGLSIKQAANDV
ncbi:MAG: RNA-binding transcriptional accessory protein [Desulfuromonas sp.]|nr:RNA-binding transcriptional accessory protein [Desulfuromonas sp.]